jgi:hypothetical protein
MPTEEEKKNEKMVDIDTTGPGAEVELPEEKEKASVIATEPEKVKDEKVSEDTTKPDDAPAESTEQTARRKTRRL